MLHRQRGKIVFECDGCEETLDTGTSDFQEAREELQAEHWQTRSTSHIPGMGDWSHYCPGCRGR